MGDRKSVTAIWVVGLILGLGVGVGLVLAEGQGAGVDMRSPAEEPVGSAFTYQGRLTDSSGVPIDDDCDFEFGLWDSLDGSTGQIGGTDTVTNVTVGDGLFTVQVNEGGEFGMGAFSGVAHWLEIGVRCPAGGGSYTTLSPRQELTAAPYAHHALEAGDLACLKCVTSSHIENGTILFADLGQNGCEAGQVMKRDSGNTAWECASDEVFAYQRTVLVSPVGTPTENGTALLDALAGITDASDTNRYLLKIEPGVYDLGTNSLSMKQYVDVEGSGQLATTIQAAGASDRSSGTVMGADDAELRFLTVVNEGGANYAIGIYNVGVSPRLTQVRVTATGAFTASLGVHNGSSWATMTDVTVTAAGGEYAKGVQNVGGSPTMTDVTANASLASEQNTGVYNDESSPSMTNVTAIASGGDLSVGVRNAYCSVSVSMDNVTAIASGAVSGNRGVWNQHSSATMTNVTVRALGTQSHGLDNSGTSGRSEVTVDNSRIKGGTNSIYASGDVDTYVAGSQLAGGAVNTIGGATITCAGVYDESYSFYASSCP